MRVHPRSLLNLRKPDRRFVSRPVFIHPRDEPQPNSWWAGANGTFYEQARQQAKRMAWSRWGRNLECAMNCWSSVGDIRPK